MRDRLPVPCASADTELEMCDAVRRGEMEAYESLWAMHVAAARRYAEMVTNRYSADDLTSEAFTRIFAALRAGKGPTGPFRPYLYVTVRNIALAWTRAARETTSDDLTHIADPRHAENVILRGLENGLLRQSFATLPLPWQTVLWMTIVDEYSPAEAGRVLSLSPNAAAALAYRARQGLRHAWIQAHVSIEPARGEHRWALEHVGRGTHRSLSVRAQSRYDLHLRNCRQCADRAQDAVEDSSGFMA